MHPLLRQEGRKLARQMSRLLQLLHLLRCEDDLLGYGEHKRPVRKLLNTAELHGRAECCWRAVICWLLRQRPGPPLTMQLFGPLWRSGGHAPKAHASCCLTCRSWM